MGRLIVLCLGFLFTCLLLWAPGLAIIYVITGHTFSESIVNRAFLGFIIGFIGDLITFTLVDSILDDIL